MEKKSREKTLFVSHNRMAFPLPPKLSSEHMHFCIRVDMRCSTHSTRIWTERHGTRFSITNQTFVENVQTKERAYFCINSAFLPIHFVCVLYLNSTLYYQHYAFRSFCIRRMVSPMHAIHAICVHIGHSWDVTKDYGT